MSKQYGLILKKNVPENVPGKRNFESTRINRESKLAIDKALEEDPNIFAYDEIYDDIKKNENTKDDKYDSDGKKVEKKSKYILSLKASNEKRKIADERRLDKKIEKEREAEGDQFKDKEIFVTDAYRQKLLERKIYDERERKEKELEDLMDVTKQEHGMTAFYRNYLNQKVGEKTELNPKEKYLDKLTEDLRKQLLNKKDNELNEEKIEFKKSSKNVQSKRQRKESSSSDEESVVIASLRKDRKRNDKDDKRKKDKNEKHDNEKILETDKNESKDVDKTIDKDEHKNEIHKDDKMEIDKNSNKIEIKSEDASKDDEIKPEPIKLTLKEILTDLFRKRCIGDEFVEAQARYFERKANKVQPQ